MSKNFKCRQFFLITYFFIINSFFASSQQIPPIKCPNFFQYFIEGNQYIGRITLPNIGLGTFKIDVHLTQRTPIQNNNYGKVTLYEAYETTIARIRQHQPIYYRVTFPTQREIPKLTLLAVNGQELCRDNQYPPPSTNIALFNTLTAEPTNNALPTISTRIDNSVPHTQRKQANTALATQQSDFSSQPIRNKMVSPLSTSSAAQQYQQRPQVASNLNFDCGLEGVSGTVTSFIYGGRELFRGQFPWLVAVYLKRAEGLLFICGGSLVSTRTVISAAHCFKKTGLNAKQVLVILGHHDLNNFSEDGDVKMELQSLYMHPEYNDNLGADADIAILHLRTPVSFSRYIQPICIWRENDDINLIAGHKASVAGWGEDEKQHAVSPVPKVVEGDVANDRDCQAALRNVGGARSYARSVCLSSENENGPCRGDSGGGLIMKRNGRWTLRGVVSSGLTKGKKCYLSEYVYFCDLAKHNNWLRSYIL